MNNSLSNDRRQSYARVVVQRPLGELTRVTPPTAALRLSRWSALYSIFANDDLLREAPRQVFTDNLQEA